MKENRAVIRNTACPLLMPEYYCRMIRSGLFCSPVKATFLLPSAYF
jgi:hypothetical protein